jgi:molybdopterin synthase catalytic subunit
MFAIVRDPIDVEEWSRKVVDPVAGAFTSFEGRVRNHADGRQVESLVYEAYDALAEKEGELILREAHAKFEIGLSPGTCWLCPGSTRPGR